MSTTKFMRYEYGSKDDQNSFEIKEHPGIVSVIFAVNNVRVGGKKIN